jgi:hypothetical protein
MMMKKYVLGSALVVAFCCAFTGAVKADPIHLCNVSTGCSSSNVIVTGSSTAYLGGAAEAGQSVFLAFLQPLTGTTGWHGSSSQFWTALGLAGGPSQPDFSPAQSQEQIATGLLPGSFHISYMAIGPWGTAPSYNPETITLPSEPNGTLVLAFTETVSGSSTSADLVTPWSSSLALVPGTPPPPTPEPSTIVLFGAVLLGALVVKRVKA